MNDVVDFIAPIIRGFDLRAFIDILIVGAIAYWLLSLIQGTTAVALLRGIAFVFIIGSLAANVLGLSVLGWLLRNSIPALLVAGPSSFSPSPGAGRDRPRGTPHRTAPQRRTNGGTR